MSHLWIQNQEVGWANYPLQAGHHLLSPTAREPVCMQPAFRPEKFAALVGCYQNPAGGENWILKCSARARVRINGRPVYIGMHILKDRDEIALASSARFYFSTEELARVVPFPGAARPVFCTRCRSEIAKGSLAVRCPTCHSWCHQSKDKPCWLYGPTCPLDDQPTALDAGYRWTPEELD